MGCSCLTTREFQKIEVVVQKTQIKQIAQFVILTKLMSGTGHPPPAVHPKGRG
jgi:hypothetical protein